jgi:hypothetical protein
MIQEAILRDAAAEVAGIELQMTRAQSTSWLLEHGLAAVDVLDRTIRRSRPSGRPCWTSSPRSSSPPTKERCPRSSD